MKTSFGNPLMRLLSGGAALTAIEKALLRETIAALPPVLRATTEAQLDGYNLVQREIDGRALNFYRKRWGRVTRDALPPLPTKPGETRLLSLTFSLPGVPGSFHATASAVDGYFFCLAFSADLRPFARQRDLSVTRVTESWRSGLLPVAHRPLSPAPLPVL